MSIKKNDSDGLQHTKFLKIHESIVIIRKREGRERKGEECFTLQKNMKRPVLLFQRKTQYL